MWEIFKPPTDNLYKFKAITGLLVCGASIAIMIGYLYFLEGQTRQYQAQIAGARFLDTRLLAEELRLTAAEMKYETQDQSSSMLLKQKLRDERLISVARMSEFALRLSKELEEISSRLNELNAQVNVIKESSDRINTYFKLTFPIAAMCLSALVYGARMCRVNFQEWQTKVQDPLDHLILCQADSMKSTSIQSNSSTDNKVSLTKKRGR